jgi:D-3-phosphoglycerate dehydrogenase
MMGRGRVLVTPRSLTVDPGQHLAPLAEAGYDLVLAPPGRQPDETTLLELAPGCVGWLAGVEPVTGRVLRAAADLRVISRNGTGVDNIDLTAAAERGIRVERAAGANARSVAELTLLLLLAGLRRLIPHAAAVRDGRWERYPGREAAGLTLGLVGCGAVGSAVAQLAGALQMRVLAYDPRPRPGHRPAPEFRYAYLADVLSAADAISLHAPPPPAGRPLLGAAELARLRPGSLLVNTARAGLVDEAAVLAALDGGRLGGYATDVHEVEPPGRTPLLTHELVVATPHVGGHTAQAIARASAQAVANLLRALSETRP